MSRSRRIAQLRTVVATVVLTSVLALAFAGWYQRAVADISGMAAKPTDAFTASNSQTAPRDDTTALTIPVVGIHPDQLVDTYSQARANGARLHDAIDIIAQRGATVVAAATGRVEKLFLSKDGGNTIYIRSPDGRRIYYYAHLDSYAPALGEGRTVRAGELIGAVGSTGNADPAVPHLHFAIMETAPDRHWYESATAINPYPLLKRR